VADYWTICEKGHVHWGALGGAGLLFWCVPKEGDGCCLLQLRSSTVDHPGTWGIPGGAMRKGETPETAARREAEEEVGPLPSYRVTGMDEQKCGGGWTFHIVRARVDGPFPACCARETEATGWFTLKEIRNLTLHPQFGTWLETVADKHSRETR
jgi:8-oxo-dGTP diphosphatase